MGNIGRKLRKLRRSGNPQNRARADAAGLAQGHPHSHARVPRSLARRQDREAG
jgi:hypothetical protein